jgi:hypothetical protein
VNELEQGACELALVLGPVGFDFVPTGSGRSSGGLFASGEFRKGNRHLELHFRYSLGLVRYHVDGQNLTHEELVRAVRTTNGIHEEGAYPGFSDDPLDAFRRLRGDLERFGRVFTSGTDEEFRVLKRWVDEHPKARGFAAIAP